MSNANKVMVIGSNSFSGSDFVDLLLDDPQWQVIGVSRSPQKSALFLPYLSKQSPRFEFHQIDMNHDMARLIEILKTEQPAYIVNFAAQSEVAPSWEHPDHWYQTNIVALSQMTHYLKDQSWLKKYIHISSPEAYGTCTGNVTEDAPMNPSTPYAASKAGADLHLATLFKNFNFPLVTVRATNVYGAHQQLFKIIPRTAIYLKMNKKIQLHGGGTAVKSYIHIRDVSKGELLLLHQGKSGDIYHISPDYGHAVKDVVALMCQLQGQDFAAMTENVAERLGQDKAYVIDSTKIRTTLGWKPEISLEQGIQGVIDWVNNYWDAIQQQSLDYIHQA